MKAIDRGPMVLGVLAAVLGGLLWVAFRVSSASDLHASGRAGDDAVEVALEGIPLAGAASRGPRGEELEQQDGVRALAPQAAPQVPADTQLDAVPTLVGRVLGSDRSPLQGARVIVAVGYDWFALPLDLERSSRWGRRPVFEVTSAADGTFALYEELEPGNLRLAIRADGHRPRYEDGLVVSDRVPTDLGDLSLEQGVVLAGRVVDRSGKGVAGAQLLQRVEQGVAGMTKTVVGLGIPLGQTGSEGAFRLDALAAGAWRLVIDAPRFQVREVEGRTEAAGEVLDELLFVLDPGEVVSGRLIGVPSELAGRIEVQARVRSSREDVDPTAAGAGEAELELPAAARRARRGAPGADGSFELAGLVPGLEAVLTVWETDDEGHPRLCPGFSPAIAWPGTSGVELAYRPAGALAFQAVDARTGAPITEFVAAAGFDREGLLRDDDGNVVRHHPGGRARFEELRPDLPESGELGALSALGYVSDPDAQPSVSLWVRAVGYEPHSAEGIALELGETRDLGQIRLEPQPVVRLVVQDKGDGQPVRAARVYLSAQDERGMRWVLQRRGGDEDTGSAYGDRRFSFGISDDDGRVTLSARPGEWSKLWVRAEGYAQYEDADFYFDSAQVEEQIVELSGGASVSVVVRDSAGRSAEGVSIAHADLTNVEPDSIYLLQDDSCVQTDEQGVARFPHLKPGAHAFTPKEASGPLIVRTSELGDEWRGLDLREGEELEVEFEAAARGSLAGIITENGLPLAGASLRLDPEEEGGSRPLLIGGENDPLAALTDFDGSYRFASVPCASYELLIDHGDRLMTTAVPVVVEARDGELHVELSVGMVEGRVRAEGAKGAGGIGGAQVRVEPMARASRRSRQRSVTFVESDTGDLELVRGGSSRRSVSTDQDGRYVLRGVDTEQPIRVAVSARGFADDARDDLRVAPGEIKRDVDFELPQAGWITITRSEEIEGWISLAARLTGDGGKVLQRKHGWVGAGKSTELGSLKAGTWTVTAHKRSDGELSTVGEKTVEVRVGEGSSLEF